MSEVKLCEIQLKPKLHDTDDTSKIPGNDCRNSHSRYLCSHLRLTADPIYLWMTTFWVSSSWPHVWEAVFSSVKVSLCLTEGPILTTIMKRKARSIHQQACLLHGTSALGHMKAVLWEAQQKLDSFISVSTKIGIVLAEGSF